MRPLFLIMSAAGTVPALGYCLARKLIDDRMKARWRQILLRMSVLFYLFPFAYFEFYPKSIFMGKIPVFRKMAEKQLEYVDLKKTFVITDTPVGRVLSKYEQWYEIFCAVCILVAVCVLMVSLLQFLRNRRVFYRYSENASREEQQMLDRLGQSIHLSRKVRLMVSEKIGEPLVMGIFVPTIMVPKDVLSLTGRESVLLHELAHIKHRDIVWRLLGLMAVALHWYNPFCYLLNGLMYTNDELSSDETATAALTHTERFGYCENLIRLSGKSKRITTIRQATCFTGHGPEQTKRRIDEIMREKRLMKPWLARGIGVGFALCALSVGFLYTPPILSYANEGEAYSEDLDFDILVMGTVECSKLEADCDEFFVAEDGTVLSVEPEANRSFCTHEYVEAVKKEHKRRSDGGCVLTYYNTTVCKHCKEVKSKEFYKQETYETCPH